MSFPIWDRDQTSVVTKMLDVIASHQAEAEVSINLVASENSTSPLAKLPLFLDMYHRYFFNLAEAEESWDFRGTQGVSGLEMGLTLQLLRELSEARYVNARMLSGLNCMTVVISALADRTNPIVATLTSEQGAHYATRPIVERLGFEAIQVGGSEPHAPDFDEIARALTQYRPGLIYVDQSNAIFPMNIEQLVLTVKRSSPATIIHVDMSHWLGLMFGQVIVNPLELGADSISASTHKTFPGPQKAFFATNVERLWRAVNTAQYDLVSSHHFAATAALGISLLEFKYCDGREYARQIVANANRFAHELYTRGIEVVGYDNGRFPGHQLWIASEDLPCPAHAASSRLYAVGIRVNALPSLPGLNEPAVRLGLNEATFHGLREADLSELADIFVSAIFQEPSPELRVRTAALRRKYYYPYSFVSRSPEVLEKAIDILMSAGLRSPIGPL